MTESGSRDTRLGTRLMLRLQVARRGAGGKLKSVRCEPSDRAMVEGTGAERWSSLRLGELDSAEAVRVALVRTLALRLRKLEGTALRPADT